ncbi:MAG: CinA family protein [Gammaproteobacteria bacterium]
MTVAAGPDDAALEALGREVGAALAKAGWTLATAESCTGGWIAKALTDVPGSSAWLTAGIVSYSNDAKSRLLAVPGEVIGRHGAVSEPVVCAMVRGALACTGADVAVAVSGIAGPEGGTPDKPVGTVWFAWGHGDTVRTEEVCFDGGREAVRRQTVRHALEGVRAMLGGGL